MPYNLVTGTDEQAIEGLKHAVSGLDDQINTADTGIAAVVSRLNAQINTADTGISAVVSDLVADMSDVSGKVTDLIPAVSALTAKLETGAGIPKTILKTAALTTQPAARLFTDAVELNSGDQTTMTAVADELAINVTIAFDATFAGTVGYANANGIYFRTESTSFFGIVIDPTTGHFARSILYNKAGSWYFAFYPSI